MSNIHVRYCKVPGACHTFVTLTRKYKDETCLTYQNFKFVNFNLHSGNTHVHNSAGSKLTSTKFFLRLSNAKLWQRQKNWDTTLKVWSWKKCWYMLFWAYLAICHPPENVNNSTPNNPTSVKFFWRLSYAEICEWQKNEVINLKVWSCKNSWNMPFGPYFANCHPPGNYIFCDNFNYSN
jgi:hypothetical protein